MCPATNQYQSLPTAEKPLLNAEASRLSPKVVPVGSGENTHNTRHLNQTDLARRWRISPRTLERWRLLQNGPAFLKIGGRVVYRITDIEAYEARQARG